MWSWSPEFVYELVVVHERKVTALLYVEGAAHNRTVAAIVVCVVLLSPQAQAARCQ